MNYAYKMNSIDMNMVKMVTPNDILEERQMKRRNGVLAHSANESGTFFAREGCPCYTCRDVLDPTGEEDAKLQNEVTEECRPRTLSLNLPPPSPAKRATAAPTGLISPLVNLVGVGGIVSPRSISDASVNLDEQIKVCEEMEAKVVRYLERLMGHYKKLEALITTENEYRSHDEMAAFDTWWSEIDEKLSSTEDLFNMLKKD